MAPTQNLKNTASLAVQPAMAVKLSIKAVKFIVKG